MKRINILFKILCVAIIAFIVMRIILGSVRGTSTVGGEALLLLIPLFTWLVFKNIDLTKEGIKDANLSAEAENAGYIKCEDHNSAIQITDIHIVD